MSEKLVQRQLLPLNAAAAIQMLLQQLGNEGETQSEQM